MGMSRGSSNENGGPGSSFSRCFLSYGDGKIEIHASSTSQQEDSSPWPIVCRNFCLCDTAKRYVYSPIGLDVFIAYSVFLSWFSFSVYHVMHKYLSERNEITFDKIFDQRLGKFNNMMWVLLDHKSIVVCFSAKHNIRLRGRLTWRLYFKVNVIHSVRFGN